ncbi:hypothetical protein NIES4071_83480 [Calothrix sp. NIES-4071]|nr:hypothetical protein NIES4071_83480 [Calothrix sp. NIES-4071]BAZ62616.1 hypothetical protein NIES4105_83410 [Calothrix sp. NIES-4105]
MSTTNDSNLQQPTPEQIQYWKELDELDCIAFAGKPVSDSEFTEIVQSLLDGSNWVRHLNKVKAKKQQLLAKVAELEEIEREIEQKLTKSSN